MDIDSFYPSVEIRENSSIKDKPVIVGQDPKKGKGRGVVVSCSYAARKLGIHSGMPISRAYKIDPDAVYLKPNFPLYGSVSRKIMSLLREYADGFEQVSIDEAFLDVTGKVSDYESARLLALQIKQDIESSEGLTCSIGVAPNKSSAKIASEFHKPNGLTVVTSGELMDFLSPLPASAITGIGKKTEEYLKSMGVNTIGDLQKVSGKDLVKWFGKTGVWLWGVAHGLERIEVSKKTMKSLSVECTFESDVSDKQVVIQKIEELSEKLHKRILSSKNQFRVVGIKIRFTHFQTYTRENTLSGATTSKDIIIQETKNLFREFERNHRKVRLIGLFVADLSQTKAIENLEAWV